MDCVPLQREQKIDGPSSLPPRASLPVSLPASLARPALAGGVLAIRADSIWFTVLLGFLAALPPLSIDISQPTLLAIQGELGSSLRTIGLTLTVFMVGFAAGQFGTGPVSDRYGRRRPLLASLVAYAIAALGCTLSVSGPVLVAWRLLQGAAAGACVVLAFAVVRDLFEGEAARAKRSYITAIVSVAPMLAPTLGAFVLGHWGWRPVYAILAAGGVLLLAAIASGLGETLARVPGTRPLQPGRAYAAVLSDRRFVGMAAVNALSYGGVFAYIAGSPEVLIGNMGLSPGQYGLFFACTAAALTVGAFASGRTGRLGIGPGRLVWTGLVAGAVSALALAAALAAHVAPVAVLLPLTVVNLFCRGLTVPNAQHLALEPMRDHAGTAAAALGVMQILTGAAASAAVAFLLPSLGSGGMVYVMAAFALASLGVWLMLPRGARAA